MKGLMLLDTHPIRHLIGNGCGRIFDFAIKNCSGLGDKISETINGGGIIGNAIGGNEFFSDKIEAGINAIQPVGYAICALFFFIALLELAMSERMTMEYLAKFFSKLVIGVAAVFYANDFVTYAWDFGDALSSAMANIGLGQGGGDTVEIAFPALFNQYLDNVGGSSWLALLAMTLGLGIPITLASYVVTVVVYIICLTRLLEMMIRGVFMPIACALLSDDGWRGAGGRYIRKFIGICAQGAVLVVLGNVTSSIMAAIVSNLTGTIKASIQTAIDGSSSGEPDFEFFGDIVTSTLAILGVAVACVSMMFKSIGIVNDAFGG